MEQELIDAGETIESQDTGGADPGSGDVDPYEAAAENPAVKDAFERVFGNKSADDDAEADPADEGGEAPSNDEATPDDKDIADESGSDEAPPEPAKNIKPTAKPGQEAPVATLSPALKQAALRAKWEPEAVEEFFAANPELATRTFENLQASHNELSRRFAQLGVQRVNRPAPQVQQPANPPASGLDGLMAKLDEFGRNNGTDIAEQLVKPLFKEVIEPFRQMQAAMQQQQQQAMAFQVHQTFDAFKDFADLYGTSGKAVTPEQGQSRFQVATLADQIRAGASLQGVDMPVNEAIQMAHDLFTADRKQATARQQVQQQVVNRSKRITARPTQRRQPATANEGAVRTDKTAASAVSKWWAERGVDA